MRWHECIAVYLWVLCGCGYLGFDLFGIYCLCIRFNMSKNVSSARLSELLRPLPDKVHVV